MITVIGRDGGPLAPLAAKRLATASLVVGAPRLLDDAPAAAERVVLGNLDAALARLAGHPGDAVVLASGDPGFFGIVRALRRAGLPVEVMPAVSSVATAFARLGLPWDDAVVVSAHGAAGERSLRRAVNVCLAYPKVAVLTGPGAGAAELAAALPGRRLVVASRLGTPDERVGEYAGQDWPDPNLVLALPDLDGSADVDGSADLDGPARWLAGAPPGPAGWALAESAYAHRDAMVTKSEVRAYVLARLGPRIGDLTWDVGAGSGSVAIECARFGAAAYAVDRDPEAGELIRRNAREFGVPVQVVVGEAPAALTGLPDPDGVFVGGGGPEVLAACAAKNPARLVAAYATLERVGPAIAALTDAGYRVSGTQLQASRLVELPGGGHRLAALNPVTVLAGELP